MKEYALEKLWELTRRLEKKLEAIAIKHNIQPKTFFYLWLISLTAKTLAFIAGAVGIAIVNHDIELFFVILNRCAASLVPIYIIFWGRKLHWAIRPTYIALFIFGTFGLENFFNLIKGESLKWYIHLFLWTITAWFLFWLVRLIRLARKKRKLGALK